MPGIAWWPGKIRPKAHLKKACTQMDLFTTFATLAGQQIPTDRVIDGQDLTEDLLATANSRPTTKTRPDDRPVFYYRGNLLMAVRSGSYKMHLWTWTTPQEEIDKVFLKHN